MRTVYVAMSGGVDSSVAALLLKRKGFRVVGVFMKPWSASAKASARQAACMWHRDREDALAVSARLGIELKTWDFSRQYGARVATPMVAGYRRGITPNPDVDCNRHIKFGLFAQRAFREGADFIATGHYARVTSGKLMTAVDGNKDQTYFLWGVPVRALTRTLFPIGHLTKPQVRAIARRAGLATATKKDSQGVCFVGDMDVKSFLAVRITARPGDIMHVDGRILGRHDGAAFYTTGQRHGLDIKDGDGPYFVVRRDMKKNVIVVGDEKDLLSKTARITHTHWFGSWPSGRVAIKVRYRTPAVPATLSRTGHISFTKPVRAIAPGQSAVFYQGRRVLGGGILA